jgi:hypothetical protein
MRLARHQHTQLVAHAVDGNDGAVVDRRQFAIELRGFDFDNVRAGMRISIVTLTCSPLRTARSLKTSPSRRTTTRALSPVTP